MFAIGLAIYGVGSLTTALSPSLPVLLVGWSGIEGLGAIMVIPGIAALTAANYEGKDRALAYALIGGITAVAVAAGPLIGGWVTTNASWRYVFAGETVIVTVIILLRGQIAQAPKAEHPPEAGRHRVGALRRRPGTGRLRDPDGQQVGIREAARGADDQRTRDHPARLLGGALHGPGRAGDTGRVRPLGGAQAPPGPRPPPGPGPAQDHAASRRAHHADGPAAGADGALLRRPGLPAGRGRARRVRDGQAAASPLRGDADHCVGRSQDRGKALAEDSRAGGPGPDQRRGRGDARHPRREAQRHRVQDRHGPGRAPEGACSPRSSAT